MTLPKPQNLFKPLFSQLSRIIFRVALIGSIFWKLASQDGREKPPLLPTAPKQLPPKGTCHQSEDVELCDLWASLPDSVADRFDSIQDSKSAVGKEVDIDLQPAGKFFDERQAVRQKLARSIDLVS